MPDKKYAIGNNNGKKLYRCLLCRYDGLTEREMERHLRVIHKVGVMPAQPKLPVNDETLSTVEGLMGTGLVENKNLTPAPSPVGEGVKEGPSTIQKPTGHTPSQPPPKPSQEGAEAAGGGVEKKAKNVEKGEK
jgi:hypothetical protein